MPQLLGSQFVNSEHHPSLREVRELNNLRRPRAQPPAGKSTCQLWASFSHVPGTNLPPIPPDFCGVATRPILSPVTCTERDQKALESKRHPSLGEVREFNNLRRPRAQPPAGNSTCQLWASLGCRLWTFLATLGIPGFVKAIKSEHQPRLREVRELNDLRRPRAQPPAVTRRSFHHSVQDASTIKDFRFLSYDPTVAVLWYHMNC